MSMKVTHIYTGVTQIFVDLGQDNDESDVLTIDPDVNVPVIALGGGGDDEIQTARGADKVSGGAGNDKIRAGAGNDIVSGGEGNDDIIGSAGADNLSGNDGDDHTVVVHECVPARVIGVPRRQTHGRGERCDRRERPHQTHPGRDHGKHREEADGQAVDGGERGERLAAAVKPRVRSRRSAGMHRTGRPGSPGASCRGVRA